jgi:enterochelin esterase-like enzyme
MDGMDSPTVPDDVADHARETGPLESPWIWITCLALAVLALVLAIRYRRKIGIVAVVLFLLLAGITGLNSYVGYVRTQHDLAMLFQRAGWPLRDLGRSLDDGPADAQRAAFDPRSTDPDSPTVDRIDLPDPVNGIPAGRTFVLLPPGYQTDESRRYPVVYLVHGYPYGGPEDWLAAGDAPGTLRLLDKHKTVAPMIVVSVDLTAGDASKSWDGLDVPGGPRLETYLARTVVSAVDQRYRTVSDRGHRALGGMSGGAFAALNIGLHHLDTFGSLLITLPYDTLDGNEPLLGGDRRLVSANTPRDYIPTMSFPQPVSVMLTAGSGGPTDCASAARIAAALRARGQRVVVRTEQGFNHTWHTARATLPYLLAFADGEFRR